jgi:type VI secretion system protein ImpF
LVLAVNMPNSQPLTPSLLDRLVDLEPRVSHEPVQYRLIDIREIKASVIRDLENLLNTRKNIQQPPPTCPEVTDSLFTYGLRDHSAENPKSPAVRQKLRQELEKIIATFEPRLQNVSVRAEAPGKGQRALRFRISALLVIDPVSEPISFDTYFDLNRSDFRISE